MPIATCSSFHGRADVELRCVLVQSQRRRDGDEALDGRQPTCSAVPRATEERILCMQVQFCGAMCGVWTERAER